MGWPTGIEPVITGPQPAVLPLHHGHHDGFRTCGSGRIIPQINGVGKGKIRLISARFGSVFANIRDRRGGVEGERFGV
ncbi:MAG: hypothetical protein RL141_1113 [Candidatus Parcubacteria bacterium]